MRGLVLVAGFAVAIGCTQREGRGGEPPEPSVPENPEASSAPPTQPERRQLPASAQPDVPEPVSDEATRAKAVVAAPEAKLFKTTAEALCREHQKDPNAVRQKYAGNHVRLTGKVERKELGGLLFVTSRDKKQHLSCVDAYALGLEEKSWEHEGAWKGWLSRVRRGHKVTIVCDVVEPTEYGVVLSHCFGKRPSEK